MIIGVLKFLFGILKFAFDIIGYLLNIKLMDIPRHLAFFGISCGFGYCAALFVIGFPVSLWEAFTKKQVDKDKEDIVIRYTAILFSVALVLCVISALMQEAS